jgi:hypothetical protein
VDNDGVFIEKYNVKPTGPTAYTILVVCCIDNEG